MARFKSSIEFGVIGLGRFGFALAEMLADSGHEILVLDNNESKIHQIQDKVQQALVVKQMDKATLEEAGIQNCDTVIVCIGEKIEASIMTVLNVIELGVPRVIAKAISAEQGRVLQKIGAEVVYPERDQGIRLANTLTRPRALEFIDLSNDFAISEIKLTQKMNGKIIMDAGIRKKFMLNIIAVVRDTETIVELSPDFQLYTNDMIAVVGKKTNIQRFEKFLVS